MDRRKALVQTRVTKHRGKLRGEVEHREGVLLTDELVEERAPEGQDPIRVPIPLLIAFTKSLIRNNPNHDLFYMSISAADKEMTHLGIEVTDDEFNLFIQAVYGEADKSVGPKGFYSRDK